MTGARVFVAVAFLILGASFIASTAILINEFQRHEWLAMVAAHSHLFFFFPVFGVLALVAFYLPSVVFTDLYWNHLRLGKLRFFVGLVVVAAVSCIVAWSLNSRSDEPWEKPRSVWEVAPAALESDRAEPPGCGGDGQRACRRAQILETLTKLTAEGRARVGLSKHARNCTLDPLLEEPEEMQKERYCFPAKGKLTGAACCNAQKAFAIAVDRLQADPSRQSLTAKLDWIFLPLKVFFVLIVVAIGALLAVWRGMIDQHYRERVPAIERGIIVGAMAMLFWPIMDYGYQQTSNVLFGRWTGGFQLRLSLVIAPWALLLLFYFLRRLGRNLEMVGQISGVVAAAVAILRYEQLNDWAVRLLGVGAGPWILGALIAIAVAGLVALLWRRRADPPAEASLTSYR